jgi:hypothetical protein
LKELGISESLEQIKLMKNTQFKNIVKEKVKDRAFQSLMKKQGSKGRENKYSELSMAENLLPTNDKIVCL